MQHSGQALWRTCHMLPQMCRACSQAGRVHCGFQALLQNCRPGRADYVVATKVLQFQCMLLLVVVSRLFFLALLVPCMSPQSLAQYTV